MENICHKKIGWKLSIFDRVFLSFYQSLETKLAAKKISPFTRGSQTDFQFVTRGKKGVVGYSSNRVPSVGQPALVSPTLIFMLLLMKIWKKEKAKW